MTARSAIVVVATTALLLGACTAGPPAPRPVAPDHRATACASCPTVSATATAEAVEIPAAIQAWMDRLTVAHEYDPATGFIVAREVVPLPPVLTFVPTLDEAFVLTEGTEVVVIAFATADRCAPCQQFKRDALNDPAVIARLERGDLLAVHVEVDRDPEAARRHLGGPAIPMSYALRDGQVISTLRGQRPAADLLAWLDSIG